MHQNVNVSHYDGEMTFLGTPNRPSVSHHSWRTCRPMEPKADMCDAGGTAVLTPSMLTAVARRSKVTEAEDKSPQGHSVRPAAALLPSFRPRLRLLQNGNGNGGGPVVVAVGGGWISEGDR